MVDDLLAIAQCGLDSLAVNTFINVSIGKKKLRFNTPDQNKKSKCHKIHIGIENRNCPVLRVHGEEMPSVSHDTYLGDILSCDGKNKRNIENRVSKGRGRVAEIMGILHKISLGKHFFKIAIVLRETILIGSILTNSEVWYRLTAADVADLESIDRNLLKRICSLPNSAPTAAVYLELGCMQISTIIKARRLNYLHYLVKLGRNEMLSRFFWCQWWENDKYDWTFQVRQDLVDFDLPSDLDVIASKSTISWKQLVKKQAKHYEYDRLVNIKNSKVKGKDIVHDSLKMQNYLVELNEKQAKLVMKYRLKMSNYSSNFKMNDETKKCPVCQNHDDTQELAFHCPSIQKDIDIFEDHDRIYGTQTSASVIKTLESIERIRSKF